ncbi:9303_t:CDS:1, partial [Scutellospora calospora]
MSSPSTAINTCYQTVFNTRTEYSGLAVMGFENEEIIRSLIIDIVFFPIFLHIEKLVVIITNIGNLDVSRFYGVSTGFVSSFIKRYHGAQHLFILKIKENQCIIEIYLESVLVNKIVGETPDETWKKIEIYQKYTGTYLFGITDAL